MLKEEIKIGELQNKKNVSLLNVLLSSIILLLLILNGVQYLKIHHLKNGLLTLIPGEVLPDLKLLNLNNDPMAEKKISQGIKILLLFKNPCSACNANLTLWKSLARYFGDNIDVLGIITGEQKNAAKLLDEGQVNFQLYMPEDKDSFRKKMRIKFNEAETIVVQNNKIKSVHIGTLTEDDFESMIISIKKLLAIKKKR